MLAADVQVVGVKFSDIADAPAGWKATLNEVMLEDLVGAVLEAGTVKGADCACTRRHDRVTESGCRPLVPRHAPRIIGSKRGTYINKKQKLRQKLAGTTATMLTSGGGTFRAIGAVKSYSTRADNW